MSFQIYPASMPKTLNQSQVFTASDTWTVPSDVTFIHVKVVGGTGSEVDFNYAVTGPVSGAAGGTTTVGSISAPGGAGGYTYGQNIAYNNTAGTIFGMRGPLPGYSTEAFVSTIPGESITVTVGSGTGSYATISWSGE